MHNANRWKFRIPWILLAVLGLPEAATVAIAHLARHPETGGIGNVHSNFAVMLAAGLSAIGLAAWFLPATIYACFRWREFQSIDFGMLFLSACTAAVVLHPGWFF